jgi:hypothetical protein
MKLTKRLQRIIADLEILTNELEPRGFEREVAQLDKALDEVEDVELAFAGL